MTQQQYKTHRQKLLRLVEAMPVDKPDGPPDLGDFIFVFSCVFLSIHLFFHFS
jgi:hypothetical protein